MGCRVGPLHPAQQCLSVHALCLLPQLLPAFSWPGTGVLSRLHHSTLQQRWQVSDRQQNPSQHADSQSTPGRCEAPLQHEYLSSGAKRLLLSSNAGISHLRSPYIALLHLSARSTYCRPGYRHGPSHRKAPRSLQMFASRLYAVQASQSSRTLIVLPSWPAWWAANFATVVSVGCTEFSHSCPCAQHSLADSCAVQAAVSCDHLMTSADSVQALMVPTPSQKCAEHCRRSLQTLPPACVPGLLCACNNMESLVGSYLQCATP